MTDDQELPAPNPEPTIAAPGAPTGPPDTKPDPEADFLDTDPGSFATMARGDEVDEVGEEG